MLNANPSSGIVTDKRVTTYRDLIVWQKSVDLVEATYRLSKKLPAREMFGLTSQMQRAAVSIPANIAEGHGRRHLGDYLHYLSIANGSLKELETHCIVAVRLGYWGADEGESVLRVASEVGRMLARLAQKLRVKSL